MSTRRRIAERAGLSAETRTMTEAGRRSHAAPDLIATRPVRGGLTQVWLRKILDRRQVRNRSSRAVLDQRAVERARAMLGCAVRGIRPPGSW
jgi:hypothetical protein